MMTHAKLRSTIGRAAAGAMGLAFTATLPGCAGAAPGPVAPPLVFAASAPAEAQGPKDFASRILAVHNRYRTAAGVAPLRWEPRLAADAARFGPRLAALGRLVHSPRAARPGQSENLWRGGAGAFAVEAMVESWASERRYFRSGVFPNVSTTGKWLDVSHYTQMIWPGTTHVGCAFQRAPRWDYLICRYSPRGNIDGRRVP